MFYEFMNNQKNVILCFFCFFGSIKMKFMLMDSYLCYGFLMIVIILVFILMLGGYEKMIKNQVGFQARFQIESFEVRLKSYHV